MVFQSPLLFLMEDPTSSQHQKLLNLWLYTVIMITWILFFKAKILHQPITGTRVSYWSYTLNASLKKIHEFAEWSQIPEAKRSVLCRDATAVIQLSSGILSSKLFVGFLWAFGSVHKGLFFVTLQRESELMIKNNI